MHLQVAQGGSEVIDLTDVRLAAKRGSGSVTRTSRRLAEDVSSADGAPNNPAAARRRLGADLRILREKADLKLDAPADRLQRSTATLSRLENGKAVPRVVDVAALIAFYREVIPDVVGTEVERRLLRLADEARKQGWLSSYGDVLSGDMTPEHIRYFVNLESAASEIREFEPEFVPGLVQTRAYADVLAQLYYPKSTAPHRKRLLDFRMARQQVLHRTTPLRLRLIIGQGVLRRPVGGPVVMREQLQALRAYVVGDELPHVDLQIAPDSLVSPAVYGGPFLVMLFADDGDRNLVYVEGRTGETYLEKDSDVASYRDVFEQLSRDSLDREATADVLSDAIGLLR